jgi:glycosyltransferase involved in cell wall biosynthesis
MASLTIIVIGLNDEDTLVHCFESINQSIFKNNHNFVLDKLLYVDSGSSDNSVSIAEKFNFEVVKLDDSRPNAAKGRATGLLYANSDYVCFLDSDMVLLPNTILEVAKKINNGFVGVTGPYFNCHIENLHEFKKSKIVTPKNFYGKALRLNGFFFVKREAILFAGNYDGNLRAEEETDLLIRIKGIFGNCVFVLDNPAIIHVNKRTLNFSDRLKLYVFTEKLIYPYVVIAKNFKIRNILSEISAYKAIALLFAFFVTLPISFLYKVHFVISIILLILSGKQGLLHLCFFPLNIVRLYKYWVVKRENLT